MSDDLSDVRRLCDMASHGSLWLRPGPDHSSRLPAKEQALLARQPRRITRLVPLVSVALALALGSAELSPAQAVPRSAKTLRQVLNALPQQRVGSAAGLDHESGTGHNDVIPPSSRSRYPLLDFSA